MSEGHVKIIKHADRRVSGRGLLVQKSRSHLLTRNAPIHMQSIQTDILSKKLSAKIWSMQKSTIQVQKG